MKKEYHYSDLYLKPRFCKVSSRQECDTSVRLGKYKFDLPVFAANMKSVVNIETCEFFASKGMFYSLHRFNVNPKAFTEHMHNLGFIASISLGINQDTYLQAKEMLQSDVIPEYITIDVANAWSEKTKLMIQYLKENFKNSFLIVGNVACYESTADLISWGADAVKVGIAGGKVCITKNKTGFHRPMGSCVLDCARATKQAGVPLIADGGVVEHGDIAKALACGADMVMAGSLFAGFDESAGDIIEITLDNKTRAYKEYYGSASQYNKREYKNIEGKKILIDYKGSMDKLLIELKEDLQSAISYAGGHNLDIFKEGVVELIQV